MLLLALCNASMAFSPQTLTSSSPGLCHSTPTVRTVPSPLFMAEEGDASGEEGAEESAPAEEEAEAPPEDPEVVALKEEIANLESELKSKKSNLSYQLDQVEEFSKAGYARTVAEMENMRRARTVRLNLDVIWVCTIILLFRQPDILYSVVIQRVWLRPIDRAQLLEFWPSFCKFTMQ